MKATAEKTQDPETQREPRTQGLAWRAQDPGIGMTEDLKAILPPPLCPGKGSLRNKGETTLQLSPEHPRDSTHRVWGTMFVFQTLTQTGVISICR